MATVYLPPTVQPLLGGRIAVAAEGRTIRELLADLEARFPGVLDRLCETGELRPGVSVVVNGSMSPLGLLQHVTAADEIHFLPLLGGG